MSPLTSFSTCQLVLFLIVSTTPTSSLDDGGDRGSGQVFLFKVNLGMLKTHILTPQFPQMGVS